MGKVRDRPRVCTAISFVRIRWLRVAHRDHGEHGITAKRWMMPYVTFSVSNGAYVEVIMKS